MCGRFTANVKKKELEEEWNLAVPDEFKPRYNIAPSQLHPIIVGENTPVFKMFQWGLVPVWIKKENGAKPMINTRIESLEGGNMLLHSPCLIPATSWFEWLPDKTRQPFLIKPAELNLFSFAGICHSRTLPNGTEHNTFSIVTTKAAKLISHIHKRMPLIIGKDLETEWLKLKPGQEIKTFTENACGFKYEFYPVSSLVNKTENDTEEVLKEFRETLF